MFRNKIVSENIKKNNTIGVFKFLHQILWLKRFSKHTFKRYELELAVSNVNFDLKFDVGCKCDSKNVLKLWESHSWLGSNVNCMTFVYISFSVQF